jgi:hypothetical protein
MGDILPTMHLRWTMETCVLKSNGNRVACTLSSYQRLAMVSHIFYNVCLMSKRIEGNYQSN